MGILVSFLRGIVSLVLFAAAVTTVVIDMEFIGEKLGNITPSIRTDRRSCFAVVSHRI